MANLTDYCSRCTRLALLLSGCMAEHSPHSQQDGLLEREVAAAFSNVSSKRSNRRIAGCAVLRALAISGALPGH